MKKGQIKVATIFGTSQEDQAKEEKNIKGTKK